MWSLLWITAVAVVSAQHPAYDIDYSDADARLFLRLSAAAYAADPRICVQKLMPANESWTIVNAKEIPCDAEGNVCAVVVMISHVKKEILVSYRGDFGEKQLQQEVEEWMGPDVNWYDYGNVGQFFVAALNKTWVAVQPTLMNPSTVDYKVTFTGYSLGGAIASLSSMSAFIGRLRQPAQIRLVTFGEPRVGDEHFAASHDRIIQNSYRVIHKADIVPHLIACRNNTKYICDSNAHRRRSHHGTEVWYNNDMGQDSGFVICSKDDEDSNCSNSLHGNYNMDDHRYYFDRMVSAYGSDNCNDAVSRNSAFSPHAQHLNTFAPFIVAATALYRMI